MSESVLWNARSDDKLEQNAAYNGDKCRHIYSFRGALQQIARLTCRVPMARCHHDWVLLKESERDYQLSTLNIIERTQDFFHKNSVYNKRVYLDVLFKRTDYLLHEVQQIAKHQQYASLLWETTGKGWIIVNERVSTRNEDQRNQRIWYQPAVKGKMLPNHVRICLCPLFTSKHFLCATNTKRNCKAHFFEINTKFRS